MADPELDPWAPTVDRYVICGLPEGHPQWWEFAVFVTRRWEHQWDVKNRVYQIDTNGVAEVVPREWDWDPYLMDLPTATRVAVQRAKTVTTRGRTAEQILEEERCQKQKAA